MKRGGICNSCRWTAQAIQECTRFRRIDSKPAAITEYEKRQTDPPITAEYAAAHKPSEPKPTTTDYTVTVPVEEYEDLRDKAKQLKAIMSIVRGMVAMGKEGDA